MEDRRDNCSQNPFTKLSEDLVCYILCRTSPLEVCNCALVSKQLKSAADSDVVWGSFVSLKIISRADASTLIYSSKKELCLSLVNSTMLLDGGKLGFSLDKSSGKICFIIGANELTFGIGDWEYTSCGSSRFSRAVYLDTNCTIDFGGKISTHMLSKETTYGVYLVFKFARTWTTLHRQFAQVKRIAQETGCDDEILTIVSEGYPISNKGPRRPPVKRDDEWMEMEVGDFYNSDLEDDLLNSRFIGVRSLMVCWSFLVEGVELRPKIPAC